MNFNIELELDNRIFNVEVEFEVSQVTDATWDSPCEGGDIESRELTIVEIRDAETDEIILTPKESKALVTLLADRFDETLDDACYEHANSYYLYF